MIGKYGEQLAVEFLSAKGYEMLAVNWRWQKSELDIVAREGNELVFVEVKTRKSTSGESPESTIDKKKQHQLLLGANAFIETFELELECRFDVICVWMNENPPAIVHYLSAFYPLP